MRLKDPMTPRKAGHMLQGPEDIPHFSGWSLVAIWTLALTVSWAVAYAFWLVALAVGVAS